MPKQYPSRASLRSPAPLSPAPLLTRAERRASQQVNAEAAPAPCEGAATPLWAPVLAGQDDAADSSAAAPGLSSTRAARRDADSGPRRFASQNRMVHQGSIAAVTGAIILATFLNFSGGQEAAAEEGEDPRPITLAGGLPVVDRGALVSRAAERDGQDGAEAATLTAAPADAVPGQDEDSPLLTLDTAQTAAEYQLERAAHVLATEARTTPEQREDLLQTAAVMRELLEQIQMPDAPAPADPAIAETISEAIEATQVYAEAYIGRWLEPDHPIVQAAVLNMFTSDLESLMDDSVPVGIFVEAAPDQFLHSPLANWSVSSPFGYRHHPIFGSSRHHNGVDLRAQCGTPVFASASGTVTTSGWSGPHGNYIRIDHGYDLFGQRIETMYSKLQSRDVAVGDVVRAGDRIGLSGRTGHSTGCHLHFEVRVNDVLDNPVNWIN